MLNPTDIYSFLLKEYAEEGRVKKDDSLAHDLGVKLILGAVARTLGMLQKQWQEYEANAIKSLAHRVLPSYQAKVRPNHVILQAKPSQSQQETEEQDVFSFSKKKVFEAQNAINYSPISGTPLTNGQIAYLVFENKIQEAKPQNAAPVIKPIPQSATLPKGVLWIGLKLDKKAKIHSKGLPFFFDLKGEEDQMSAYFYHQLQQTFWFAGERLLKKRLGVVARTAEKLDPFAAHQLDDHQRYENELIRRYQKHFITIDGLQEAIEEGRTELPNILKNSAPDAETAREWDTLIWLRVENFPTSEMKNLFYALNCFIAINRTLETTNSKYSQDIFKSFIPIHPSRNKKFWSIDSVVGKNKTAYSRMFFRAVSDVSPRHYVLRSPEIHRFDRSRAKEMLTYFFQTLENEALHTDDGLKEIRDHLKEKLFNTKMLENAQVKALAQAWIIAKSCQENEQIKVQYWSTDGEQANDMTDYFFIKNKTRKFEADGMYLVKNSASGTDCFSEFQQLEKFKHRLHANEKITSRQSIRMACYAWFGKKIKDVQIEKTVVANTGEGKWGSSWEIGFKVILDLDADFTKDKFFVQKMLLDFQAYLQEASVGLYPILVSVLKK